MPDVKPKNHKLFWFYLVLVSAACFLSVVLPHKIAS